MRHTSPLGAFAIRQLVPGMPTLVPAPRYVQPGTFAHEDRVRRAMELAGTGLTIGEAMEQAK
jgi:hypothetical protein